MKPWNISNERWKPKSRRRALTLSGSTRLPASSYPASPCAGSKRSQQFYNSVITNRRAHLQQEIADIKLQIADEERRQASLDAERSGILRTLEGRGALDDFLELQRDLAEWEANAATLRERFKAAEILEGESTQLDIDRSNLKRRLQEDHQGRKAALDEAILLIAEAIANLYQDRSGRFVVEATDNGPEFQHFH